MAKKQLTPKVKDTAQESLDAEWTAPKDNATPTMKQKVDIFAPEPADDEAIFVYCKLPNGMIFDTPTGKVRLRGAQESQILLPDGEKGYGMTKVTEEQWNYIAEVYGSMKVFHTAPPLIFAASTKDEGEGQVKEYNSSAKTGLEQMDPSKENKDIKEMER